MKGGELMVKLPVKDSGKKIEEENRNDKSCNQETFEMLLDIQVL